MKVAVETIITEISQTVVSMSNKVVEHNQVLAQALEDIIALAELCKSLRERVELLEGKADTFARDSALLRRDMMNRTDPRNFEIDPRSI